MKLNRRSVVGCAVAFACMFVVTHPGHAVWANDGSQVVWSTYFGTDDRSFLRDIDVDSNGDVYLGVSDLSRDLPHITPGAFQENHGGGDDLGVAKLSADGTQVLWATYCGGTGDEGYGPSIRVLDSTGEVFVVSGATSGGAPVSGNAYDPTFNGGWDMYVCKFSADGSALSYGTYIGGSNNEGVETHNLAVNAQGEAFVGTGSQSSDYPTTNGVVQPNKTGQSDVVISKFSADGSQLLASTFLGGNSHDWAEGLAVDDDGNLLFAGGSSSSDFPITAHAFQTNRAGDADLIAVKLSSNLDALEYSTFVGGSVGESGRCADVDGVNRRFLLGGHGQSDDWPLRNEEQSNRSGHHDGYMLAFQFPEDGVDCAGFRLGVGPLSAGSDGVFEIEYATPGRTQYLAYSLRGLGRTYIPQLNATLDLERPKLAASKPADGSGYALMLIGVPPNTRGINLWMQVAEQNRVTNVVQRIVY